MCLVLEILLTLVLVVSPSYLTTVCVYACVCIYVQKLTCIVYNFR